MLPYFPENDNQVFGGWYTKSRVGTWPVSILNWYPPPPPELMYFFFHFYGKAVVMLLKVNDHYFYTEFPDFIKTSKTSHQIDVDDPFQANNYVYLLIQWM